VIIRLFRLALSFVVISFFTISHVRGELPRSQLDSLMKEGSKVAEAQMAARFAFIERLANQMTLDYDLSPAAEKAVDALQNDAAFKDDLRLLSIDPERIENAELFFETRASYWRKSGKASGDLISWMDLVFRNRDSWYKGSRYFEHLSEKRQKDFVPNLLLLNHAPNTSKETQEWVKAFEKTFGLATNDDQKLVCLVSGMAGVTKLMEKQFAKEGLESLAAWLKGAISNAEPAGVQEKIKYLQLFTAITLGDLPEMAIYAKGTPLRCMVPMYLLQLHQYEKANQELTELRTASDLSDKEKELLKMFGPVVDSVMSSERSKKP
jgi:hypothetical protein